MTTAAPAVTAANPTDDAGLLARLDDASDRLSPIVVKEVRQIVRGREFNLSFGLSLLAGLAVAFVGAANALTGEGTSGRGTFVALTTCLGFIGLAIVPIGAFSALRNERIEQTLDLITLTTLSPLRLVVGKLLAQGVKLATFFAGMTPFIAMSFLLGGVDFVTIGITLGVVFMLSMWVCAASLCLSTLARSRAATGVVLGGLAILVLVLFSASRFVFVFFSLGIVPGFGVPAGRPWAALAVTATFCAVTMVNLVLVADNRLSLPSESKVTGLRVGFLAQFLLIVAWTLKSITTASRVSLVEVFGVLGGLHLAVVAMFTVTEDLAVSRRAQRLIQSPSRWRWLLVLFRPGGSHGAVYVLAQMVLLLLAGALIERNRLGWLMGMCGYICFFTGIPAAVFRWLRPNARSFYLRVAVLVFLSASMLLPDLLYYVIFRPDVFDFDFTRRHLFNPVRALANWREVVRQGWFVEPFVMGVLGLLSYWTLIVMGRRANEEPSLPPPAVQRHVILAD